MIVCIWCGKEKQAIGDECPNGCTALPPRSSGGDPPPADNDAPATTQPRDLFWGICRWRSDVPRG